VIRKFGSNNVEQEGSGKPMRLCQRENRLLIAPLLGDVGAHGRLGRGLDNKVAGADMQMGTFYC
jgi:hypothetical protein